MNERRIVNGVACLALVALMSGTAAAQTVTRTAFLTGGEEAPTPVLTGAFATGTVTIDLATQTITYRIDVFNMPSGLTAGHIHVGSKGVAGPTIFTITIPGPLSNDFTLTGTWTSASVTPRPDQGIRSFDDAFQSVVAGEAYLNLHTQVNGGGEIRGQLVTQR